uniref:transmembrane protein 132D-like n=1 Tax=Doryrhamphus excisus TaxID=161450 RepID=UPI0025AE35B5|nr:transmembrane protein 132D-like [Doryrhamphus excisus]XP_057912570.1 transmembrane protein 132D-like [Doryrhamphus excisus]XP_057912571.1 transmembrane protein 132D-like [Doryrhamphus excisus]
MLNFLLRCVSPLLMVAALTQAVESQQVPTDPEPSAPLPVYPSVSLQVLNVDHVLLRQDSPGSQGNSSLKTQTQTFLITDPGPWGLQPALNASYGPLTLNAPIAPDLLLRGPKILPFILSRQVRSPLPVVKILFHMPGEGEVGMRKEKDEAHCVTAYAFWGTREVRGACLVSHGGFCVAQLRPEPAWFNAVTQEMVRGDSTKGLHGNVVEVYFQSRRDRTRLCVPQDSLQRFGRGGARDGTGTPMRRIGSVKLLQGPPGKPPFLRLNLGGAMMVQTSPKPLKTNDTATFNIFLTSPSTLESFTLRTTAKSGLVFSTVRPSDGALWDVKVEPGRVVIPNTVSFMCRRKVLTAKRGLVEVVQVDFVVKDVSEQAEAHVISWRLDQPGNVRNEGQMQIYTSLREYAGLAPLVMSSNLLNTAALTGKMVKVPVKTFAVYADGSVTDVSSFATCRSTDQEVLKVSERCDYLFVTGRESRGKRRLLIKFMHTFLSAQLEMSVWIPRLPLTIDVADPELNQIKGWRVPITTSNHKPIWNSEEEEEEMRKGRGCMLQFQHSTLRVLTHFVAEADLDTLLSGGKPVDYLLGPDWQVDVTNLVRYTLKVADPEVARVQHRAVLQGRAVGRTTVQVISPLTSSVLAERSVTVVDDKVSVTELGVQLVSEFSLSLQPSPAINSAIIAMATIQETVMQVNQEAFVSCWVQFSDGAVVPLTIFDRSVYSLSVTTPDEAVATVRRSPLSTFVVARGEGGGKGALVNVELRISEECQKSRRKSKLAVGTGLLRIDFQGRGPAGVETNNGGAAEMVGEVKSTVTTRQVPTETSTLFSTTVQSDVAQTSQLTVTPPTVESSLSTTKRSDTTLGVFDKEEGQKRNFGNMLDNPNSTPNKADVASKQEPPKSPKFIESDLIRTFRSLSDLEICIYSLVGVLCIAIFGFLLNCASHRFCFRNQKTPKNPPGVAPPQVSTLTRSTPRTLPAVNHPAAAERTATLGRSRTSSQQHLHRKVVDPMANRSATLLARPHRSEPLHSPTSKRNQVQLTTFTTLDIKHLAALKKNGVDFHWTNQQLQAQQQPPPPPPPPPPVGPQIPLPDMPWPVVKPLGETQ